MRHPAPHRNAFRCGFQPPPLLERVVVSDEAVEPGDAVVERAGGGVVVLGRPIEAAGTRVRGPPAATASISWRPTPRRRAIGVDEEILEVADLGW